VAFPSYSARFRLPGNLAASDKRGSSIPTALDDIPALAADREA
jgi:hypothetical protein